MGKRSPGPMSYIREASALRNIKLCYAGRSFSIRVVIRCLRMIQGVIVVLLVAIFSPHKKKTILLLVYSHMIFYISQRMALCLDKH